MRATIEELQAEVARLQEANAALAAHMKLCERLQGVVTLEEIARTAITTIAEAMAAEGGGIMLTGRPAPDGDSTWEYGMPNETWSALPEKTRRGLLEMAMREEHPLASTDAGALLAGEGLPEAPSLENVLFAPMRSGSRCAGGAVLFNFLHPERLDYYAAKIPALVVPICHVISHVDLVESYLREARLLEAILENVNSHVAYLDSDFDFIRVNSAFVEGCGHSREELMGRNHFHFFPDPENQAIFEQVRDSGGRVEFREKPFEYPDQPERGVTYWDWILTPIKNEAGAVEGLVLSLTDMTEKVRARERIAAAERERAREARLLETIVENIDYHIAYLDRNLKFLQVNSSYCEGSDYPREGLIGREFSEVFPNALIEPFLGKARDVGENYRFREVATRYPRHPERGMTYWDCGIIPVKDQRGEVEGIVMSSVDVTEHVRTRERMLAAERERTRLAENLAVEVNHRTKNNLAMVAGLLQLQVGDEAEDRRAADIVRDAIARIRTFAAVHEQLYERHAKSVELLDAMRRIAEVDCEALSRGRVELLTEGEPVSYPPKIGLSICVAANELITNAIKHGSPGPNGRLHIKTSVSLRGSKLHLSVWNSGNPVPPHFDPSKRKKMGLRLIHDMTVGQYKGTFTVLPHEEGTLAQIIIDDERLRQDE
ncbi:MAG: PAS domain S-box protein [Armatimonadetes bacterium]|nr:PAS domain S-box protein [Armatimonadota bacterium]NIM23531.1 PAS domain S-box protein [Armatimonadota bacterium]NIM67397.1 PAS domain S-box protein [Armatimonadota bacterium]NIM75898.1 PAS domain S-box protein [Armatimonadota bacterium]NIN05583.1 PAS domain S-box protein [Armatimonadota bacterium]